MLITLISCDSSSIETTSDRLGRNYYPIEVGQYRIYNVSRTTYFVLGPQESTFQLRERVIDSVRLENSQDEFMYTLERSVRPTAIDRWEVDSIWTTSIDQFRVIANENNERFVKLVFPIENNLEWNGNSANSRPFENYRYQFLPDTTLLDEPYENVWVVHQSEQEQDILGRNIRSELYAPDIGLVAKNESVWEFCQLDACPEDGTITIVNGREVQQTLIEYGKE